MRGGGFIVDIKEVFEKCNDGDYVVDNNNKKWKVVKYNDKGDLTNECDLTSEWDFIANFYTLTEIFDLEFKKVYGVEINAQSIEDAKINAELNNVSNIELPPLLPVPAFAAPPAPTVTL